MTREHPQSESSDADIEVLLRRTGARMTPSSRVQEEIRSAVHAEWRAMTHKRKFQRRMVGFAIAASVAAAVALTFTTQFVSTEAPVSFAVIERVEGTPPIESATQVGRTIMTGETLTTDANTRVALAIGGRISLRLDGNTALAVLAPDRVELRAGAVYVDAGAPGRDTQALDIVTAAGNVRHLGTQYLVRSEADTVAISVREGRIQLTGRDAKETAQAGEKLVVSERGAIAREAISPHDASWTWATRLAPPFEIENQSLAAFLNWAARETGRTLVYVSADAEAAAANLTLHGSIANLPPDTALDAVLSTTEFQRVAAEAGLIRIALRTPDLRAQDP